MDRKLTILGCAMESDSIRTGDDHATALVVFMVYDRGKHFAGTCRIKQTVGADRSQPFEVTPPLSYSGPDLPYTEFRSVMDGYYRRLFGEQDSVISIGPRGSVSAAGNWFSAHAEIDI